MIMYLNIVVLSEYLVAGTWTDTSGKANKDLLARRKSFPLPPHLSNVSFYSRPSLSRVVRNTKCS